MAGVLMIKCEIKYLVSHSRRTPDAHFHHTFKRLSFFGSRYSIMVHPESQTDLCITSAYA